jgi:hypothetical protein
MTDMIKIIAVAAALVLAGSALAAEHETKMFRWVDDQGVVHVGDHIPPEYANKQREVLNSHGIAVSSQKGALTPQEKADQDAAAARAEKERKQAAAVAMRDHVLLDTYLSVEEIEALRDRRLELIASQVKVTEAYLQYLRAKQQKLKTEALDYKPYNANPKAQPIDDKLASELAETMNSILLYEKDLTDVKFKQAGLVAQFTADIQRFKELKSASASAN